MNRWPARRLLGMGDRHRAVERAESNLVGRRWEMSAVEGLLDRAIDGHGAVVGVVGLSWHRQEPSGARGVCDGGHPWCGGVHGLLRVAHQSGPLPCRGAPAALGQPRSWLSRKPVSKLAFSKPGVRRVSETGRAVATTEDYESEQHSWWELWNTEDDQYALMPGDDDPDLTVAVWTTAMVLDRVPVHVPAAATRRTRRPGRC